ncbi:MAG: hypothetical protein NZ898_06440 [Myxococcota bacterium]|nr:hypothetical protein [Myxococcota bacterium]MDW8362661.1 hypothetical protein [Myxococcales bacterium]
MIARTLTALRAQEGTGRIVLRAPMVGWLSEVPRPGAWVWPGGPLGMLEVLGVRVRLLVPEDVEGRVVGPPRASARVAVDFGAPVVEIAPSPESGAIDAHAVAGERAEPATAGALVVRAPMSGRFYLRPSPGQPPFAAPGAVVERGQPVGLLEVMKTFHRIPFDGVGWPDRARVRRWLVADGEDVAAGARLVELEPAP